MSTFSQFTGGNRIKSIQRGEITIHGDTSSATIASVDTTKAELRMLGFSNNNTSSIGAIFPKISLASSTQIAATRGGAGYGTTVVSWELTEFI